MFYKLRPRVRMFIETVSWTGAAVLSVAGLTAMLRGQVDSPQWWVILVWLAAAGVGASIRKVPFHIEATDRSRAQRNTGEVQAVSSE